MLENDMMIRLSTKQDVLVMTISGAIDHNGADELTKLLADRIAGDGLDRLLLDLSSVTGIDPAGVQCVQTAAKQMHDLGGKLAVQASKDLLPERREQPINRFDRSDEALAYLTA